MTIGAELDLVVNSQINAKKFFDAIVEEIGMTDAIIALVQYISEERQEALLDQVIFDAFGKTEKSNTKQPIEYNGKELSITEWSKVTGIERNTLKKRLDRGWSVERALTEKLKVGKLAV